MSLNAEIPRQGRCFSRCPRCIIYVVTTVTALPQHAGQCLPAQGPSYALGPSHTAQQLTVKSGLHRPLHPRPGSPTACGCKATCLFGINQLWSHFNNAIHPFKVGRILTELRLQIILLKYYIMTSMVKLFILIFIISKKSYHHIIPVVLV